MGYYLMVRYAHQHQFAQAGHERGPATDSPAQQSSSLTREYSKEVVPNFKDGEPWGVGQFRNSKKWLLEICVVILL